MLKNMIKDTPELKIDFDTLPTYHISDEDLKCALWGINIIKEITSNNERVCNF
jgi:hypothetical protein